MNAPKFLRDWFANLTDSSQPAPTAHHAETVQRLTGTYGIHVVESDPKGNARPWRQDELDLLTETLRLLGPTFSAPFLHNPLHVWLDRTPGGGSYGNQWLRIGEPGRDLSILYRIFLHEGTHASNEYRGWPYENEFCTRPGLDWRRAGDQWTHPRQQGKPLQPGPWETLPVDSRDVSTAPGEDLAETVRYYVHSVRNERAWLWPLDLSSPPLSCGTHPRRGLYTCATTSWPCPNITRGISACPQTSKRRQQPTCGDDSCAILLIIQQHLRSLLALEESEYA